MLPKLKNEIAQLIQGIVPLLPNRVYRGYTGGALIDEFHGEPSPQDSHLPEEWVGSVTRALNPNPLPEEGLSKVRLESGAEVTLKDILEKFPEQTLGAAHVARLGTELGVLVKVLDSAVRLILQCHPTKAFAKKFLNFPYGKTESYIVLRTREIGGQRPYILLGFKAGVTRDCFEDITRKQDREGMVNALNKIEPRPGDVYLIEAGTPHAIGPGVFMIEVQEPSDLAIGIELDLRRVQLTDKRLFMGLGFDLGMSMFNYSAAGDEFLKRVKLSPKNVRRDDSGEEYVLIGPEDTDCFSVRRMIVKKSWKESRKNSCYVAVVLNGTGRVKCGGREFLLKRGNNFFMPASARETEFSKIGDVPLEIIKCFPPQ